MDILEYLFVFFLLTIALFEYLVEKPLLIRRKISKVLVQKLFDEREVFSYPGSSYPLGILVGKEIGAADIIEPQVFDEKLILVFDS